MYVCFSLTTRFAAVLYLFLFVAMVVAPGQAQPPSRRTFLGIARISPPLSVIFRPVGRKMTDK